MWREIGHVFQKIGSMDDNCRCILLNGHGKNFCSGIDVSDPNFDLMNMANQNNNTNNNDDEKPKSDVARKYLSFYPKIRQMQHCLTSIEQCPIPVIVAIHGSCIGGGIDVVCCADIRICTSNTIFSVREVKLGLAADVGTLQRLPKIVGSMSRVRELCFTGKNFNGYEAEKIGLVSRIVETQHQLMTLGLCICDEIARNSPIAVQGTKLSLNYSRDHTVQEGLEHIAMHNAAALMTDDLSASFVAATSRTKAEYSNTLPHAKL